MKLVDDDRRDVFRRRDQVGTGRGLGADVDGVDAEELREDPGRLFLDGHLDRVVRPVGGGEADAVEPAAVLRCVARGEARGLARVVRERLRARKRRRVGGRLRAAVGAIPGSNIEDERSHPEQDGQKPPSADGLQSLAQLRLPAHS